MNSLELYALLQRSGINPQHVVVCGSTPIATRFADFREPHDIDVVVSPTTFVRLFFSAHWRLVLPTSFASWREIRLVFNEFEVFMYWKLGTTFVSYRALKKESQCEDGVRCAHLVWVKRYKRALQREKDIRDLAFLRLHYA
jgi:hypothetical protein